MANKIFKAAAMMILAGMVMFNSCQKESTFVGEDIFRDVKSAPKADDELVDIRLDTLQTVKEEQRVITVTPVEIYKTPSGYKEFAQKAFTLKRGLHHEGVPVQYFEPKAFKYETSRKSASYKEGKAEPVDDNFTVVAVDSTVVFEAVNAENETFETSVTTGSEWVYFTFFSEKLNRTLSVEFRPLTWTLEEKTSPHKDVSNIAYKGDVWDAVEYRSNVLATFSLGGKKEVTNLAYLLKHKIDVDIDKSKLGYEVEIKEGERKLYKDPQTVSFELVTKDNGKEIGRVPYRFEEAFEITATAAQNKTLASEDAIKAVKVDFTKGEIKEADSSREICFLKTFTFDDVITVSDGNVINVKGIFEALGWNTTNFSYASTTDARTAVLTMSKASSATAAHPVYDMRLTLNFPIVYNNTNKSVEPKTIVITWQDDCYVNGASLDFKSYVLEYQQPAADTMSTKVQYYTAHHYEANNGNVVDEDIRRDLEMGAKLELISVAQPKVDTFEDLAVSIIPDGGDKTTFRNENKALGLVAEKVSTNYRVLVSNKKDGKLVATYKLTVADERDLRNGADFGHHASFNRANIVPFVKPANVASTATDRNTEVGVKLPVERSDRPATKAAGDEESFTLASSFEQSRDAVKGNARDITYTVRPSKDGIDVTVKSYHTNDGVKEANPYKTDTKTIWASFEGMNGSLMTVNSVSNYATSGNGMTATAESGNYTNHCVLGFDNTYRYSYTKSVSFTDEDGTVDVPATFVIASACQPKLGNGTANGAYTVYPYSCANNATLTCGTASLELTGTATRDLQVSRIHHRQTTYTAGNGGVNVNHRAWYDNDTPYYNETKFVAGKIEGVNGEKKVSTVSGYQTTGNGTTATSNTTYSVSASNGKSADSFSPKFNITVGSVSFTDDAGTFSVGGTMKLNAGGSQTIDNGTNNGDVTVYQYAYTVSGTFTCGDATVPVSATSNWKLSVENPVEDLVGNLKWVKFSVVPTTPNAGYFFNPRNNSRQVAAVVMVMGRNDGSAAPIVWSYETDLDSKPLPTDDQLRNATWHAGNYDERYNSAADVTRNGGWVPAIGWNAGDGIRYTIPGGELPIYKATLQQWGWRGGNYTVDLSRYSATVVDGVCTIYIDGNVVKRFK